MGGTDSGTVTNYDLYISFVYSVTLVNFPSQESTDKDIPMCVIGNKVDLRAERPEGSCVSSFHGEKLAMVSLRFVKKNALTMLSICNG